MIESKEQLTAENLAREEKDILRRYNVGSLSDLYEFPRYFQIENTKLCNATCPFCPVDVWDKSVPFMSKPLFYRLADEIIEHREIVKFAGVWRAGEPLLDKDVYNKVDYLKRGGVKFVAVTTNASALSSENAKKLLSAGVDEVMLSIDSVEKEQYEKIRVGLNFETVMENITGFFKLRDELRPECVVRVRAVSFHDTTREEEMREIEQWENFWAPLKQPHDRVYMKRAHTWGNQKVLDGFSPEYGLVYHPCVIPFSTMHITSRGTAALCPQDYDGKIHLGDLNTSTIKEVWQSEAMRNIREMHLEGRRNEIEYCRGCRLFDEDFSLEDKSAKLSGTAVPTTRVREGNTPINLKGVQKAAHKIV